MRDHSMKLRVVSVLVTTTLMVSVLTFVLGPLRGWFAAGWAQLWLQMWLIAFPVALLAVWFLAPLSQRIARRLVGASGDVA